MNRTLSKYFKCVAAKILSAVEVDPARSNQHEFNGSHALKKIFGSDSNEQKYDARFISINDEYDAISADGSITWYDARENHLTRSEFRMYYTPNEIMKIAAENDTMIIARCADNSFLLIIAKEGSTIGSQLLWLFGITDLGERFQSTDNSSFPESQLEILTSAILNQIGIETVYHEDRYLEEMLHRFDDKFPSSSEFSRYAASTLNRELENVTDPDQAIMLLVDREYTLFRTLEQYIIAKDLSEGKITNSVEGFLKYSLHVQNRRKSRSGFALENHLESILISNGITYSRTPVTENNSKPDFIFPNISFYRNSSFDDSLLTMLGVKTTCKDRWRQVLSEAERITAKHLLTIEAAISINQTKEMSDRNLKLVIPESLHCTYRDDQKVILMSLTEFINMVEEKQRQSLLKMW